MTCLKSGTRPVVRDQHGAGSGGLSLARESRASCVGALSQRARDGDAGCPRSPRAGRWTSRRLRAREPPPARYFSCSAGVAPRPRRRAVSMRVMHRPRGRATAVMRARHICALLLVLISGARVDVAGVHPSAPAAAPALAARGQAWAGAYRENGDEAATPCAPAARLDHGSQLAYHAGANGAPAGAATAARAEPAARAGAAPAPAGCNAPTWPLAPSRAQTAVAACDDLSAVAGAATAAPAVCYAGVPRGRRPQPTSLSGSPAGRSPVPTTSLSPGRPAIPVLQLQPGSPLVWTGHTGRSPVPPSLSPGRPATPVLQLQPGSPLAWTGHTGRDHASGTEVSQVLDSAWPAAAAPGARDADTRAWSKATAGGTGDTKGKAWTRAEDDALRLGVALYGHNWLTILRNPHFSRALLDRTVMGLEQRWSVLQATFKLPLTRDGLGREQMQEVASRYSRDQLSNRSLALYEARAAEYYPHGAGSVRGHEQAVAGGAGDLVSVSRAVLRPRINSGKWSMQEQGNFMQGLRAVGWGAWEDIAEEFVPSRTPQQVATHAASFFFGIARPFPDAAASIAAPHPTPPAAVQGQQNGSVLPSVHTAAGDERTQDVCGGRTAGAGRGACGALASAALANRSVWVTATCDRASGESEDAAADAPDAAEPGSRAGGNDSATASCSREERDCWPMERAGVQDAATAKGGCVSNHVRTRSNSLAGQTAKAATHAADPLSAGRSSSSSSSGGKATDAEKRAQLQPGQLVWVGSVGLPPWPGILTRPWPQTEHLWTTRQIRAAEKAAHAALQTAPRRGHRARKFTVCSSVCMHTHVHAHTHTRARARARTHTRARAYTRTHARTLIHTHIHTRARIVSCDAEAQVMSCRSCWPKGAV